MGAFYNSLHVLGKTQQEVHDQILTLREEEKCIIGTQRGAWVPVFAEVGYGMPLAQSLSEALKTSVFLIDVHDDDVFYYFFFKNGESIDEFDSCPDYFGGSEYDFDVEAINNTSQETLMQYVEKLKTELDFSQCTTPEEMLEIGNKIKAVFQDAGFMKNSDKQQLTDDGNGNKKDEEQASEGNPERLAELLKNPADVSKLAEIMQAMQNHETVFVSHQAQEFCDLLKLPNALNSYDYLLEEELPIGYIHIS